MHNDSDSVQQSINLFSRVLAVLVLVILPGLGGLFLDKSLGTYFFAVAGFGIGLLFGALGLWALIKHTQTTMRILKKSSGEVPNRFEVYEELKPDDERDSKS